MVVASSARSDCFAMHSPILMAYPGATLYDLGADGVTPIAFEETEHYQVTRAFLTHRERMLRELFSDAE